MESVIEKLPDAKDRGSVKGAFGMTSVVIVSIAAIIGLFFLGWWIKSYSVNRNAEILQDTFGRQNALVEQINDDIIDAETSGIPAGQRVAIVNQICDAASKLTGSIQLSVSAQTFVLQECPR